MFIVYGVPIISFLVLVGTRPLRSWRGRLGDATVQGLGWYGAMSIVAILVTIALALVYEIVDPGALALLSRPNPELTAAASNPWFYVGFSFVIGAIEETIFRGRIFGYWMARGSRQSPPAHAIWTSIFFGAVHLYYGTTYGAAYPLVAPSLFFIGFAFAKTMQNSGGNLVIVALLHGANDRPRSSPSSTVTRRSHSTTALSLWVRSSSCTCIWPRTLRRRLRVPPSRPKAAGKRHPVPDATLDDRGPLFPSMQPGDDRMRDLLTKSQDDRRGRPFGQARKGFERNRWPDT